MTTPALLALAALLRHVDAETCTHEETCRAGAIWTICNMCGKKWADDCGGFKPHVDHPAVANARRALAAPSAGDGDCPNCLNDGCHCDSCNPYPANTPLQVEGDAATRTFIALIGTLWMNEGGSGGSYSWDGNTFTSRDDAIKRGFELRHSDDFNVGVLRDGRLVSFDWMSEVVNSDPALLLEIAEQIGLPNAASLTAPGDAEAVYQLQLCSVQKGWVDVTKEYYDAIHAGTFSGAYVLPSETRVLYTRPAPEVVGDVCNWRQQDECGDHISTGCGHEFVLNEASDYEDCKAVLPHCPYCAHPTVFQLWRKDGAE